MNRLLLTAAAACTMAFSGQAAIAAAVTIDGMDTGKYFDSSEAASGGLSQTFSDTIGLYGIGRSVSFTATPTDIANFDITDPSAPTAVVGFGSEGYNQLDVANNAGIKSSISIHYDLTPLVALDGANKGISFKVLAATAGVSSNLQVIAYQHGVQIGDAWRASSAIPGDTSGYSETATFAFLNPLSIYSDISLEITGDDGYVLSLSPITFVDVSPVPEPGEWAMLVAGLGVIGAAARRRSAISRL